MLASPGATSLPAHVIIRELDLPVPVRLLRLGPGGDDLARLPCSAAFPPLSWTMVR
jgi:glutathione S-transferase